MKSYFIYKFLDKHNSPIYIGRTKSMDNRFFYEEYAHFAKGSHLTNECYKEVERIDYVELCNESEQAVYEIALINKLRPKYNKQYVDSGQIQMELPSLEWKEWESFSDEIKLYLSTRAGKAQSIQECIANANIIADMEKRTDFFRTGYIDLDRQMMIRGSNLILISGITGVGKTAFSLNMCCHCLRQGKRGLLFGMKDNEEDILLKMLSQVSVVKYRSLGSDLLTDHDWDKIVKSIEYLNETKLLINSNPTIESIISDMETRDCDFVIIDDFNMIENNSTSYSKDKAFDTLRKIKSISMRLKCPIFLLHQIPFQKVAKRADTRPFLGDLEIDSFLNFCDSVIFLHRDEVFNPDTLRKNIMDVIIAKNKYGSGVLELAFLPDYLKVSNFDKSEGEE